MNEELKLYENIPQEKFELASNEDRFHDKKIETKSIGYFKDAFLRFSKNKASIIAACIVLLLVLFAIIGPFCFHKNYIDAYATDIDLKCYKELVPKIGFLEGTGFLDGTKVEEINDAKYNKYLYMYEETGYNPIQKEIKSYEVTDSIGTKTLHKVRTNMYYCIPIFTKTYTQEQYEALQKYQDEHNLQIILPWVDYYDKFSEAEYIANSNVKISGTYDIWYECDATGAPKFDENGNIIPGYRTKGPNDFYTSLRLDGDPALIEGSTVKWKYASVSGSKKNGGYNFTVRINPYNYFIYKYGFEPSFIFGSDNNGYDIFTRLAKGARFSLLFALGVSCINLFIGAIYGAVEGYYGGAADMIMERISDILSSIPSMVVTVLFNLHLSGKVGTVPALLYAFIMTGWIGMASSTRMQFYRFKNQEYVLAARTLGARDRRIMFKHIFPNSLGTLITGSVLVIPGVIFSETSLTYLGIINLDSPTRSSVGSMLSNGQGIMTSSPHVVFFPALFIALLMVSFNLFGNGLRDAFNPSLRGAED